MTPPTLLFAAADDGVMKQASAFFSEGGFFMGLLALTSVVAIMAVVFKWLTLSRARIVPPLLERKVEGFAQRLEAGNAAPVLEEFEEGRSVLARLCAVAVAHQGRSHAEIADAVQARAREEIVHLHAGMTVIDVVITVAPLLGLLGTASGLVVVFDGLGDSSDHAAIALGIGRALKTTIVGLAIAVPSVIAQGWFQRRIDTLAARLEVLLTRLGRVCEAERGSQAPTIPS